LLQPCTKRIQCCFTSGVLLVAYPTPVSLPSSSLPHLFPRSIWDMPYLASFSSSTFLTLFFFSRCFRQPGVNIYFFEYIACSSLFEWCPFFFFRGAVGRFSAVLSAGKNSFLYFLFGIVPLQPLTAHSTWGSGKFSLPFFFSSVFYPCPPPIGFCPVVCWQLSSPNSFNLFC